MNKWDAINEGGEGYRPEVKEIPHVFSAKFKLLERKDSINRKIGYISASDSRFATLLAELDEIDAQLAKLAK